MTDAPYRELAERAARADERIRLVRWDSDFGEYEVAACAGEGMHVPTETNPLEPVPGAFALDDVAEHWAILCPKHQETAAWPSRAPVASPYSRRHTVELRPQEFAVSPARRVRTLVFVGQCPECQTIYYAAFVTILKRVE